MSAPEFLTIEETAELLRKTRGAVYTLANRGKLPGLRRFNGGLLVCRRELLDSLELSVPSSLKGDGGE